MNYCNYILFEILKYKIEFSECLEYAMETYELEKKEIEKNISYLKNNFEKGLYKDTISSLFTNYEAVNYSLVSFYKKHSAKSIIKMTTSNKLKTKIEYITYIVDCYENLNNIISTFMNEQEIYSKVEDKIKLLMETSNSHFINFLYFISYSMYLTCALKKETKLKFSDTDIKSIISLMKYCNQNNLFSGSIAILEENDELKINNEFERLSNICIQSEKKQNTELKEIINILNSNLEKNKN